MRALLSKLLLTASVLSIVGGVMLAPVREGAANPLLLCDWNVPPAQSCNGLCFPGEDCATATVFVPPPILIKQICVCAKKPKPIIMPPE